MKKIIITFFIIMALLTLSSKSILNLVIPRVITAEVTRGSLLKIVKGSGRVEINNGVKFFSKNPALINKIYIESGDEVKNGDLLAHIDRDRWTDLITQSSDRESILKSILHRELHLKRERLLIEQSSLRNLKDEAGQAEIEYNSGFITKKELLNIIREIELKELLISTMLKELNDSEKKIERELNETLIFSNTHGRVVTINIKEGVLFSELTPLLVVENKSSEYTIDIEIDRSDSNYFSTGEIIRVNFGDEHIFGKIDKIKREEKKSRLITVIPNKYSYYLGDIGSIRIDKYIENSSPVIPLEALKGKKNDHYIWVIKSGESILGKRNTIYKKAVKIDKRGTSCVSLLSDLTPGERVVTYSEFLLEENSQVFIHD